MKLLLLKLIENLFFNTGASDSIESCIWLNLDIDLDLVLIMIFMNYDNH